MGIVSNILIFKVMPSNIERFISSKTFKGIMIDLSSCLIPVKSNLKTFSKNVLKIVFYTCTNPSGDSQLGKTFC